MDMVGIICPSLSPARALNGCLDRVNGLPSRPASPQSPVLQKNVRHVQFAAWIDWILGWLLYLKVENCRKLRGYGSWHRCDQDIHVPHREDEFLPTAPFIIPSIDIIDLEL